jgi:DNA-binding NarL/FixJ family response regulator
MAKVPGFLIVGDSSDEYGIQRLCEMLSELGIVRVVGQEGLAEHLEEHAYEAVILDAGSVSPVAAVVAEIQNRSPSTEVYVITASPHWRVARDVLQAGATDYMPKSRLSEDLVASLRNIAQRPARPEESAGGKGRGS